ncbi:MAG: ABC transporter ATP-binding protein [Bacillota bacterium]|nr:ABC transporter ATP-binding protein [Bacillota bacterium]
MSGREQEQEEERDLEQLDPHVLARLIRLARPYWKGFALAALLVLASTGASLARPYILKVAIDSIIVPAARATLQGWASAPQLRAGAVQAVLHLGLILLAAVLVQFLAGWAQTLILARSTQALLAELRQRLFAHVLALETAFFDRAPVGRLVTRLTNDVEALSQFFSEALVTSLNDLALVTGSVAVMFRLDARLAAVSLALMPLVAAVTVLYQSRARRAYRAVRSRLSRVNAAVAENVDGMRTVQIFRREEAQHQSFDRVNRDYLDANMRQLFVFSLYYPSIHLLGSWATALLLVAGASAVLHGAVAFGVVYAFLNYVQQLFRPIMDLAEKLDLVQSAQAGAERIFGLLDTQARLPEPGVEEAARRAPVERVRGALDFDRVWFAYEPGRWVLRDVDFHVEPGEMVAFVGPTGAGKSSIMSLVTRLYEIQRGSILLDGRDIRSFPVAELRRQVGVVMQDVFLFEGSVAENIRLGDPSVPLERVREAARAVGADRFIERLPHGYETALGERGTGLSAGERQLIAFARALCFDPPLLILDEATSNVDTETEMQIQQALERLSAGRTTLVVAHRLSTARRANRILVVQGGRIRESGSHAELLERRGLYWRLVQVQALAGG